MKLTDERIAEIEGRCEAATKGHYMPRVLGFVHDIPDLVADLKDTREELRDALVNMACANSKLYTRGPHAGWRRPTNIVGNWALDELVRHGWWEKMPQEYKGIGWYGPKADGQAEGQAPPQHPQPATPQDVAGGPEGQAEGQP